MDGLSRDSRNIRDLGDNLYQIERDADQHTSRARPYGGDFVGRRFAKDYLPNVEGYMHALIGLVTTFYDVAEMVDIVRKGFADAEDSASDAGTKLKSVINGSTPTTTSGNPSTGDISSPGSVPGTDPSTGGSFTSSGSGGGKKG